MDIKPTILIVDDDRVSLSLLSKLVEKLDYNVVLAEDGMQAFDVIRSENIDLVIADYEMPRVNGLELLVKVRAGFPRLPFIMVTAYSNLAIIREAWANGAFDFFQKPVFVDRLQQTIRLAIEYGHLSIARRKFPKTEMEAPGTDLLNTGVIRELAAALERDDLLNIVEEFETHARIELEQLLRAAMIKEPSQVKAIAHRLAGSSTNLGLIKFSQKMRTIVANPEAPISEPEQLDICLELSIQWLKHHLTQIFQDIAV